MHDNRHSIKILMGISKYFKSIFVFILALAKAVQASLLTMYKTKAPMILKLAFIGLLAVTIPQNALATPTDIDNDSVLNSVDFDDDNDGILDSIENPTAISTISSANGSTTINGNYTSSCANGTFVASNLYGFRNVNRTVDRGIQLSWNQKTNQGTTLQLTSTASGSSLFDVFEFGIAGPNASHNKDIRAQDVQVSWSVGGTGILIDPLNQVSSHADGAIINSGDVLSINNSSFAATRWRVVVPVANVSGPITIDFVSSNGPGVSNDHEGFWFNTGLACDTDGDGIPNHQDLDSDGDG